MMETSTPSPRSHCQEQANMMDHIMPLTDLSLEASTAALVTTQEDNSTAIDTKEDEIGMSPLLLQCLPMSTDLHRTVRYPDT